jgi:DNA-binding HxlR family transcriptional regulator
MVGGGLDYSAPFQRAIELIGKRWTGAVVKALLPAPARFNQLLAGIPGISDRVLTERLRELETEGLVERLVDPGPPVRVSYRLTSRGRALEPVLAAVADWAESWLTTVAAAAGLRAPSRHTCRGPSFTVHIYLPRALPPPGLASLPRANSPCAGHAIAGSKTRQPCLLRGLRPLRS